MIIQQRTRGRSRPAEQIIAVLARQVSLSYPPGARRFELGSTQARTLREAASAASETGDEFILAFEFGDEELDCIIAEVALNAEPVSAPTPSNGYVALEDHNVISQIGRIAGLEAWASHQPIPRRGEGEAGQTAGRWRWRETPASVDIVIAVHNAKQEIAACLRSLEMGTLIPHRLILVDDHSDPDTHAFLEDYAHDRPWATLITNAANLGYTRSANIGLKASAAEWAVLLNSDVVVSKGWLGGLLDCAEADPLIAAVGPLSNAASWQSVPAIRDRRGEWAINPLPQGMSVDSLADLVRACSTRAFPDTPLLNGFCLLLRREVLTRVGLLDETTFPYGYGEENDLCVRLAKAGYKLRIADDVYVHHVKSASFGAASRIRLSQQGSAACVAKHPDVDFSALQAELAECAPLIRLRRDLKAALRHSEGRIEA